MVSLLVYGDPRGRLSPLGRSRAAFLDILTQEIRGQSSTAFRTPRTPRPTLVDRRPTDLADGRLVYGRHHRTYDTRRLPRRQVPECCV